MDGVAPWSGIHARVAALTADRRGAFAMACAEHLVSLEASTRESQLRAVLADAWVVLLGERGDLAERRRALAAREDLDDDEVAAVAFALDAVAELGRTDATLWAAGRAMDAAYTRVVYEPGATALRPLSVDTAEPVVQAELAWQAKAVGLLEGPGSLPEVVEALRS